MAPDNKEWFIADSESDPEERNALLSGYLADVWSDLDIIRIERIQGGDPGWQAVYREE
ncbi:MAG: hypothetical protein JRJ03_05200 [Deltaproteobacteria bacterium]|nr:hypothetical protein [Deltaproteobacteria bacterium]MBW2064312.1 hypothetical protein [Deltaproteobacteria bacterium]